MQLLPCKAFREVPQRTHQSQLVKCRRPQGVHQPPNVSYRGLGAFSEFGEQHISARIIAQSVSCSLQLQAERRERRSEAVMKIPTDAAAFLFPGSHQPLTRTLQLGVE